MKPLFCSIIYLLCFLLSVITCRSLNNKQLLYIEPIRSPQLDIATRTDQFFRKRNVSPNLEYQPNMRTFEHDDRLRLTINAFNETVYLHLIQNEDLFHPDAVVHIQGQSIPIKPSSYRVYHGYVIDAYHNNHWWISGIQKDMEYQPGVLGWARITIRNDIKHDMDHPLFEGAFTMNGDIHHIKLTDNYYLTKRSDDPELHSHDQEARMVIFRDSDASVAEKASSETRVGGCGFDQITQPKSFMERAYNPLEMMETPGISLSNHITPFGKTMTKRALPEGCPVGKKILYMGVAADCTYVKYYRDADNARMQIINNWNLISNVYSSSLNVAIGLINITIMDSGCPATVSPAVAWNRDCSTSYRLSDRLNDFSRWRGSLGSDGAGLWHVMTNCAAGAEVGIAWKSQVCASAARAQGSEYVSGTAVSSIIRDEWKVAAHEIGHNFGAEHDCTSSDCPCMGSSCKCCPYSATECDARGRYFMNPVSNATSDAFSPCSINTICAAIPSYASCLEDPGSRTVTTLNMCGNGIKEDGEDCDPGGEDNACCDAATCKFKSGAVCDDYNDLCCTGCQFRPANYTCRPATNTCDVAEVCSGSSGDCPPDAFEPDLKDCGSGLQCASGQCTSRDAQCKARGVENSIDKACNFGKGSCVVQCQLPNYINNCVTYPGFFIDGTPCGVGGTCKEGTCNLDNFGNNVLNWINKNLKIVIPVAIVVGLLLLFCIFRCCCYRKKAGYNTLETKYTIQPQGYAQQPLYYPPPPTGPYSPQNHYMPPPNAHNQSPPPGWVDPSQYNGSHDPQQPLPAYTPQNMHTTGNRNNDSYEMGNTDSWNNHPPTPVTTTPNPFDSNRRPHNEGVV